MDVALGCHAPGNTKIFRFKQVSVSNSIDYISSGKSYIKKRPPFLFSVDILFFSKGFDEESSLKNLNALSEIIGFFQSNSKIFYSDDQSGNTATLSTEIKNYSAQDQFSVS